MAAATLVLALVAMMLALPATHARAALDGRTNFAIDGNTDGPNDWDEPPPSLLDLVEIADPCGNGVLDPTTLSGKLDDLDLANPSPIPGNVTASADLCKGWYALDGAVGPDGSYDLVLYGAWQREDSKSATSGESTVFFPLVGPAPGKADDYLVTFEYDSSGAGSERILIQTWDGSTWVATEAPPGTFEAAVDDPSGPTFGEFALDLTGAGLVSVEDCTGVELLYIFSRTGQLDSNAELADFVGPVSMKIEPCASVRITKQTRPDPPIPPADFDVEVSRVEGGPVRELDATEVVQTLTVPGNATAVIEGLVPGEDYTLTEVSAPPGWSLESITCQALDPATGEAGTFDLYPGGEQFPLIPGSQPDCVVSNIGPASLTVVKAGIGEPADFPFTAPGLDPAAFALDNAGARVFPGLAPGQYTVAEQVPDGWDLAAITCFGAQAATDPATGTATIDLAAGDRAVCTWVNVQQQPEQATLTVLKSVPAPDGTAFPVDIAGPGAPAQVVLTPPDAASATIDTLTPDPGGSDYTLTEQVPDGWTAAATTCTIDGQAPAAAPPGGPATITLRPGQNAVCTFTNTPQPPLPPQAASLTVVKRTEPAGTLPDGSGGFRFAVKGGSSVSQFSLVDGGTQTLPDLNPGKYVISEAVPAGWLAVVECDDPDAIIQQGARVEVVLSPGDQVTCTYTNTKLGVLAITKVADPMGDTVFPFTSSRDRAFYARFALDDDGDPTDDPANGQRTNTIIAAGLIPGLYGVMEFAPEGWTVTSIECEGVDPEILNPDDGFVAVEVRPGTEGACVYRNELITDGGGGGGGGGSGGSGGGLPDTGAVGAAGQLQAALLLILLGAMLVRRAH